MITLGQLLRHRVWTKATLLSRLFELLVNEVLVCIDMQARLCLCLLTGIDRHIIWA